MAKKLSFEELSKIYGIEDVDEIYHEMLENMVYYTDDYMKDKKPDRRAVNMHCAMIGNYNQNFIIINYLIKLQEQNRKLTEQNQQVIEQNQQIIDLLTEIKNK